MSSPEAVRTCLLLLLAEDWNEDILSTRACCYLLADYVIEGVLQDASGWQPCCLADT